MRFERLIFLAMSCLSWGCGGDPAPALGNSAPGTVLAAPLWPGTSPTAARLSPPGVPGCAARPDTPSAGMHHRTLVHDGVDRDYDVYIPRRLPSDEPVPLVFYLHPLLTDRHYLEGVGVQALADRAGFIAVFPQGLHESWNAGACCGPSNGVGGHPAVDDVGFVRAVLAEVDELACIDRHRVYAAGFSNGGFLAHRLACEASDVFAAIAPVAAVNGMAPADCTPRHPVAVLSINGRADPLVPYDGGFSYQGIVDGTFISVKRSGAGWAERDGCRAVSSSTRDHAALVCKTYDHCAGGVQVTTCAIANAGHCWFGEAHCAFGPSEAPLDATTTTWEFLRRFRR